MAISTFQRSIQLDSYSCGVHSVAMILHHLGDRTPFRKLRKELACSPENGTTVNAMLRAFRTRGFSVRRECQMSIRSLKKELEQKNLVLAHVDGNHFVVVHDFTKEHIFVADPSLVRLLGPKQTQGAFRKRWASWGLIVRPRQNAP